MNAALFSFLLFELVELAAGLAGSATKLITYPLSRALRGKTGLSYKRWDCYAGIGYRAGGCGSPDLRNHELRLANLEAAGHKNYFYSNKLGEQVESLHGVALNHQQIQEALIMQSSPSSSLGQDGLRRRLLESRQQLHRFPSAERERDEADRAWSKAFGERVLKPMSAFDWLQLVVVLAVLVAVVFNVYVCFVRRRRRQRATAGQPPIQTAIHLNAPSVSASATPLVQADVV